MAIKEAEKFYKPHEIEKKIQEFWEENDIYEKVKENRKNGPIYSFLDGPPYCSGRIHLGTAWNKIIKDTYLRFKSMQGFNVNRKPGWDAHGLPIEHKVEKKLGVKTKKEIEEEIGIANFVSECKKFAIENKNAMTKQFKKLGVWMDWDDPYITFDPNYIESCWWTIKKAHEKDLLKKDLRVITWCPRCETAIASAEIEYKETEDPSIYVKFPIEENKYILVWTTTPWTLPANLAVAVHPDFDYAYVKNGKDIYILAKDLVDKIFENYEVLKTVKGKELEGMKYKHPLEEEVPYQKNHEHKIVVSEHVTLSEGTGCVHIAPGHGPEDFEIGKKYNLEIFCPVDESGKFKKEAGKYKGKFVKEADKDIISDLKSKDLLFKEETIRHRYGFCWRCKTPIIYRATKQWFLTVTKIKDKMLEEIDKVVWIPEWAGMSRFKDWVKNAEDWTISRQRYWGTPLPIWICEKCNKITVVGSIQELKEKAIEKNFSGDFVHRPLIDKIFLKCECGGKMKRIPDVLDVWIDSGVAGWASINYPKEKKLFEKLFPYDFITEGHDQTRGWFYSQLGCGVIAHEKIPYKKVLMHGFTLDEQGRKMSKSLGNVVEPEEVIRKYGADVLRFYLLWANKPWEDLRFVWEEVKTVNKMFNILWNVYVFATTYMSLDNFNPHKCKEFELKKEDKWILSKVNSVAKKVSEYMENLLLHKASRIIYDFIVEDLSRWYVKLIRSRTWIEKDDPIKLGAYYALYNVLKQLITIMAPITPHITEEIYQNIVRGVDPAAPESVHMLDWEYSEELISQKLEEKMEIVRDIVEASIRARDKAQYKLRWPMKKLYVISNNEKVKEAISDLKDILLDQCNTKSITYDTKFPKAKTKIEVNYKTLGPKLRQDMPLLLNKLKEIDANELKERIEEDGFYEIEINGRTVKLEKEDLIFKEELPENIFSSKFKYGRVYIDVELTPEIEAEAMARELIRRIQSMRKDLDLHVEARIDVAVECSDRFRKLVQKHLDYIKEEVRAKQFNFGTGSGYKKSWEIDGEEVIIYIQK